ncbi:MAG: TIR domain-containing protein [Propionicimonas sp.]|uniref:hypothetical protein n=1 Tax=Propionicimonas sp. TaxID=1955623 RepID=UPI003D0DBD5C
MATAWDAFISYSRAASGQTAVAVQRGLERFARPWRRRRAARVFRDDSALSTNPALWSSIEDGLSGAGHLVVLLSPGARDSPYVEREVAWWLAHKGPATVLLVLDQGDLVWDATAGAFTDDSPVPPSLRDAFTEEPRWLDLRWLHDSTSPASDPRFTAAMADLSAPIRGIPRDELVGEDLVQHRRVLRLTRAAVTALVVLLAASIVATVLAVQQRDDVLRQATTLRSRQLASAASGLLDSDLRAAQLLAVQGYRTEDSAATRQALLQAAFASPLVSRVTRFDADITALAASTDGTTVALGLADGSVYTVGGSGTPRLRFTLPAAVTALRTNRDGSVVLAAAGATLSVSDAAGMRTLTTSADLVDAEALALSPSGRRAALVDATATRPIRVLDTATGEVVARSVDPLAPAAGQPSVYPQYTDHLSFLTEGRLRLVSNDNRWVELGIETGRTRRAGGVEWAPWLDLFVTQPATDFILAAPITRGQKVRLWPLGAGGHPTARTAGVQLTDPLGLAASPDGALVLVNDASTGLWVASVRGGGAELPTTRIAGMAGVGALAFTGPTRAVAAARTELAFLDLGGVGRDAASVALAPRPVGGVPEYAVDYRSSVMAISPDGSRIAVLENSAATLEVVPLPGRSGTTVGSTSLDPDGEDQPLSDPVWLDDDTVLVVSSAPGGVVAGLPRGVARWNLGLPGVAGDPADPELPLAVYVTGAGTVLVATSGGVVQTRRAPTAELEGETGTRSAGADPYDLGRFSADGRYVALVERAADGDEQEAGATPSLRVLDASTGAVVHEQDWPDGEGVAGLEWSGTTLLVSQLDGTVRVLPDLGRGTVTTLTTAGTRTSTGSLQANPPVAGAGGLVGVPTRSGLVLYDLATLQESATLPVPPGFEGVPQTWAFAPDGHTLVTGYFGSDTRTARVSVRDLGIEVVAAQACASAGTGLSATEWARLVGGDEPAEAGCR